MNQLNQTKVINLEAKSLTKIRNIDPRLVSYNIEMAEITGGTFWKAYTPEQIAGKESYQTISNLDNITTMNELMQNYPPINLYHPKLRYLAKQLGPAWIRVSGTWATKTYYDFDEDTCGKIPAGYQSILTKKQWIGVLDFVKSVNGKLLISISNCEGDHPNGGPLDLTQARKIFSLSHDYGVDIDAIEFMNEPNMLEMSGAPKGYTPQDYARDQDILYRWIRENYPRCLLIGPCTTGDPTINSPEDKGMGAGIATLTSACTTEELLAGTTINMDVFSYHYYNGISERLASIMPNAHWNVESAFTDEYLAVAPTYAKKHAKLRDNFIPKAPIWVTESGDAGGGGNTWASTYLDVFRTLNELGSFATITDGVIFHNTLASSDYGFLDSNTFEPRPNYFAVLIWNRLMGTTVYDCSNQNTNHTHIYCHSRKDDKPGFSYLIINNSPTETVYIKTPKETEFYTLDAQNIRSSVIQLNGKKLEISDTQQIPNLSPIKLNPGIIGLAPLSCSFIVI